MVTEAAQVELKRKRECARGLMAVCDVTGKRHRIQYMIRGLAGVLTESFCMFCTGPICGSARWMHAVPRARAPRVAAT
jgi:hypothetical protein